jgi:hypothetical protein
MSSRAILAIVGASIVSLCSCSNEKVESDKQLLGEWRMLDDPSGSKRFVLESGGKANFIGISIEDLGRNERGRLPATGTWKLSPNGDAVEFWFAFGGGDYGEIGKLKRKNGEIEVWFSVGDPDSFDWKRFQLSKPQVD